MQDIGKPHSTHDILNDGALGNTLEILSFRALYDRDPLTRKHAVYLLSKTQDPDYIDICVKAMRDSEKAVRCQAAHALAEMGAPAVNKVIPLLNDKDWKVRYRAEEVLGMLKTSDAVKPLIGLLSDEKDHVRYMAAKSLGAIGDPAALEPLRNCRLDENPYVRKMVDGAIAAIEGKHS